MLVGSVLIQVLTICVSLAALFYYSEMVGWIVLAFIPIYSTLLLFFNPKIVSKQRDVLSHQAINESNYIDTITGISEIKNFNKERYFSTLTEGIFRLFQDKVYSLNKFRLQINFAVEAVSIAITLVVIAYCSFQVFSSDLQIGELVAILSLVGSVVPGLVAVTLFNIQIQEIKVVFDRMQEFTDIPPEKMQPNRTIGMPGYALELKGVTFYYPGTARLLHDIDLRVEKGHIKSLIGESGTGKSTLLQLIQRFYSPKDGKIYLDNHPVDEIDLSAYRSNIGVVPQEVKIFNGSLAFNIALSSESGEYERLDQWTIANGLDDYFKKFPQGYATILGEEGINISGGQKQVIGIARALFRNPSFLLLDESTSALDKNTEATILSIIQSAKANVGVLLLTHRIVTASKTDYIYILENTGIADHGKPSDLMMRDNLFSSFFKELEIY